MVKSSKLNGRQVSAVRFDGKTQTPNATLLSRIADISARAQSHHPVNHWNFASKAGFATLAAHTWMYVGELREQTAWKMVSMS